MEFIEEFFKLNFSSIVISLFIVLAAVNYGWDLIVKVMAKFGKPMGALKQKKEDHELLLKTVQDLKELHNKHEEDTRESIKHDKSIENKLETLTDLFVNWEISSMRWEINNFATKISENKPCNKDCFQHCFKTYEAYEDILKERHLTNGEVEISMKIIREAYQRKMQNGEF